VLYLQVVVCLATTILPVPEEPVMPTVWIAVEVEVVVVVVEMVNIEGQENHRQCPRS